MENSEKIEKISRLGKAGRMGFQRRKVKSRQGKGQAGERQGSMAVMEGAGHGRSKVGRGRQGGG